MSAHNLLITLVLLLVLAFFPGKFIHNCCRSAGGIRIEFGKEFLVVGLEMGKRDGNVWIFM